jgi:hypothetical protein
MFNPAAPEALLCWRTGARLSSLRVNGLPVMERSVLVTALRAQERRTTEGLE